ncbi:MAG: hypothetical protein V7785_02165 [Bermanella sp.]
MNQIIKLFSVALISIYLAGCSTYMVNSYGVSVDNVESMKTHPGTSLSVNSFKSLKPGVSSIQCRGAGPVATPDKSTFEAYINKALISELKLAGIYSETSPISIDGYFEKLDFDSTIGSGKWIFSVNVSSDTGSAYTLSSIYPFSTNWVADKACQQVAQAFVPAVQNLIKDIISHPQFAIMADKSSSNTAGL